MYRNLYPQVIPDTSIPSQLYADFPQTTDDQVRDLLEKTAELAPEG
jgi:predicted phosphoribosyltransferase